MEKKAAYCVYSAIKTSSYGGFVGCCRSSMHDYIFFCFLKFYIYLEFIELMKKKSENWNVLNYSEYFKKDNNLYFIFFNK